MELHEFVTIQNLEGEGLFSINKKVHNGMEVKMTLHYNYNSGSFPVQSSRHPLCYGIHCILQNSGALPSQSCTNSTLYVGQ